jgi:hypothetical protein
MTGSGARIANGRKYSSLTSEPSIVVFARIRVSSIGPSHVSKVREIDGAAKTEPTLAIGSGSGLYLIWLYRPIPRAALPRWTACQKVLWEVLKRLAADRAMIGGDRESWASRIRSKALR